ncbi:MAG: hypothetical protein CAK88_11415 [Verrucomicrobiia bacterium AMD-G2]|nr:MAG: hypothetical protein CAK88_11415 [Verrucomicrobiae bacterium AMD-G2]
MWPSIFIRKQKFLKKGVLPTSYIVEVLYQILTYRLGDGAELALGYTQRSYYAQQIKNSKTVFEPTISA